MEFKIYVIIINVQYYVQFCVVIHAYDIFYFYKCLVTPALIITPTVCILLYISSVILSNWSIQFYIISI